MPPLGTPAAATADRKGNPKPWPPPLIADAAEPPTCERRRLGEEQNHRVSTGGRGRRRGVGGRAQVDGGGDAEDLLDQTHLLATTCWIRGPPFGDGERAKIKLGPLVNG